MTSTTEENLRIVARTMAILDNRIFTNINKQHLRITLTHHYKFGVLQTEVSDSIDAQQNLVKQLTTMNKQELNELVLAKATQRRVIVNQITSANGILCLSY